jgi:HD-GYP domain-containing protein (c-di-GMP phosphodiesterase class II)
MFDIPREILEKPQALSKSEGWHILNHPLQSYKIISRYLRCFEDVALIALQHHEAWNGEGYPKRLEGTDIELESRIVRIADAFTALISERPYRPAFGGHQAMKWLVSGTMVQFDPQLLRSFVHLMGMYPVGSLAELNNGSIVQVLEYPEGVQALKPRVRIINPGVFKPGETIDLRDEQGLFIKKALEREIMLMEAQDKLIG